jgi:cob(I)alamin adenosyltransferase
MKTVDLTNPTQKFIAAIGVAVALFALYLLLPPLIVIFTNLWIAIALGVPLLFFIWNYEMIWSLFKRLSWNMTKKIISSDKLWYLYQYHTYMVRKIDELHLSILKIGEIRVSTSRSINTMIKDAENEKAKAVKLEQQGAAAGILKVTKAKIGLLDQQINNLLPKLDFIKAQEKSLQELHDAWSADTEILKSTLDAKAEEYKLMKELSKGIDSAKAFLQKDSPELRQYNESIAQIETSIAEYTSNVEQFQRDVAPQLTKMSAANALSEDQGTGLIEEYKKKRLSGLE